MSDVRSELRTAFEEAGYDVEDVTQNRNQLRVVLRTDDAGERDLREVTDRVLDDDAVLALNVTTETRQGGTEVTTVVTIRLRPS